MNPHGIAATRSLVLLVCQFRHFRMRFSAARSIISLSPFDVNKNFPKKILIFCEKDVDIFCTLLYNNTCRAGMAELADAYGSGPYDSNVMRVQVSFPALHQKHFAKAECFFSAGRPNRPRTANAPDPGGSPMSFRQAASMRTEAAGSRGGHGSFSGPSETRQCLGGVFCRLMHCYVFPERERVRKGFVPAPAPRRFCPHRSYFTE